MTFRRSIAIAVGAVAGSAMRWGLLEGLGEEALRPGILLANLVGSLSLGVVAHLSRTAGIRPVTEAFVGAGLCGALTTWSTLAVVSAQDVRDGEVTEAILWLVANLVLGLVAAGAGRHGAARAGLGNGGSPWADPRGRGLRSGEEP